MVAAVNLGGDSDSIGAVYGQIAGAYYGFDAIPERWVKEVKTWKVVDDLIERFMNMLPLVNLSLVQGKSEMTRIVQGDITKLAVDAIVNAANQVMLGNAP